MESKPVPPSVAKRAHLHPTTVDGLDLNNLGAGDSYLVQNFLPEELGASAFEKLREEVKWNVMKHRGGEVPRLVAVEGEVLEDGRCVFF
jgi:hypothetical protein